jgi:hypothetical protein
MIKNLYLILGFRRGINDIFAGLGVTKCRLVVTDVSVQRIFLIFNNPLALENQIDRSS